MHYKTHFSTLTKEMLKDSGAVRRFRPLVAKSVSTAPEWRQSKLYINKYQELLVLKRETLQYVKSQSCYTKKKEKKRKIPCFQFFFSPLCSLWLLHL